MTEPKPFVDATERERSRSGDTYVNFYNEALEASKMFRKEYQDRVNVVKWHDMPMERSADGLIKHIVNERMDTKECCVDVYMQFLPANGASGTTTGNRRRPRRRRDPSPRQGGPCPARPRCRRA